MKLLFDALKNVALHAAWDKLIAAAGYDKEREYSFLLALLVFVRQELVNDGRGNELQAIEKNAAEAAELWRSCRG